MKTIRRDILLTALGMAFAVASVTQAATIYVRPGGSGLQNGMSWANAWGEVQTALSNAAAGDEIWVAAGTYRPDLGTNDRSMYFTLKNNVAVYGGFNGTESARSQRDYNVNPTILSGDIGVPGDNSDNTYHVVFATDVDASAILDGFTIEDGNSFIDPEESFLSGAGVRFIAASATLRNLVIRNCVANNGAGLSSFISPPTATLVSNVVFQDNTSIDLFPSGGAALVQVDRPFTFSQCQFIGNTALDADGTGVGGGVTITAEGAVFEDCLFDGNVAQNSAGALRIIGGTASVSRTTFRGGSAESGAAIAVSGTAQLTFEDCLFERNQSTFIGGAIWAQASNLAIRNSRILGNTAATAAGAVSLNQCPATIEGCAVIGNTSQSIGAIITTSMITVSNSTIVQNHASTTAGGILLSGPQATGFIHNSILWNNSIAGGTDSSSQFTWATGTPLPTVSFCNFNEASGQSWTALDPEFFRNPSAGPDDAWGTNDDDYGDVRLGCTSPLVDAGSNAAVSANLIVDLAGRPRIVDNPGVADTGAGSMPIVDLGAYESHPDMECGACYKANGFCVASIADHCTDPGDAYLGDSFSCGDPAFIVDRLGAPGGDGTAAAPFMTFAEAATAALAGEVTTLYVRTAGHYPESVTFNNPTRFVNPTGQTIRVGN